MLYTHPTRPLMKRSSCTQKYFKTFCAALDVRSGRPGMRLTYFSQVVEMNAGTCMHVHVVLVRVWGWEGRHTRSFSSLCLSRNRTGHMFFDMVKSYASFNQTPQTPFIRLCGFNLKWSYMCYITRRRTFRICVIMRIYEQYTCCDMHVRFGLYICQITRRQTLCIYIIMHVYEFCDTHVGRFVYVLYYT